MSHPNRTLSALVLLASAACVQAEAPAPNVLLICLDTVRADRLGCYGYRRNPTTPALDALASEAIVFSDASATAGWTKPSVPSFLTGTYPLQHGVYEGSSKGRSGEISDVLPERATTLAEVFQGRGYRTGAFVKNAQLRRGLGFEQGFEQYVDEAGDARAIREKAQAWLPDEPSDQPFFLYLHFLDAHWPYPVPAEYAGRFAGGADVEMFRGHGARELRDAVNHGQRVLDPEELDALGDLYDGSLRYIDDELGRLFDDLRARGLWEDTIVCVVADHGEEFMEHGRIGHGHGLWENLLRVPWILRVPGRSAERRDVPVSLVDLFPTLLAAAGVPDPRTHSGVDRLAQPDAVRALFAEHKGPRHYEQSLRHGSQKLLRRLEPIGLELREASEALAVGTRWEAELRGPGERRLAAELKPREESPDDPLELKAPVSGFDGQSAHLAGFEMRLGDDTRFYGDCSGDEPPGELLADGRWVKVRGRFDGDVLVAEKIKIYASVKEGTAVELRGRVDEVERRSGGGRLRMESVWIEFDSKTDFEVKDSVLRRPWAKTDLRAALVLVAAGETAPVEVTCGTRDLARDPGEDGPMAMGDCDTTGLDALTRAAAAASLFGDDDRAELSEEELEALRELGYL